MDILKRSRNQLKEAAQDIEKFHHLTRDVIVIFTILMPLGCLAYFLICKYRRRQDVDLESSDVTNIVDDEAFASRFVILASTVALTVSEGAILLLPFSVLANEIMHSFPDSYYFQWLNSTLIHGLWNIISAFSNVSLVFLIFAYFISESEGFDGARKGIFGRVKEALVTLAYVFVFVCGLTLFIYHFTSDESWDFLSIFHVKNLHVTWLFTCLSFAGALLLLISTPYGYAQMFSIVGRLVRRPLSALDSTGDSMNTSPGCTSDLDRSTELRRDSEELSFLDEQNEEILGASFFRRTLLYPVLMLFMLVWTSFCIFVCSFNLLFMTLGVRDLPGVSRLADVGITSLSSLGMVGACIEILIIGYTVVAFLVGFYSLPGMGRLMPRLHETSLPQIVANCALILLLSSALPLFVRVIGITNFDLLGNFVHIGWLRNLRVIVGYNIVYLVFSVLAMLAHASKAVWRSICQRLMVGTHGIKKVAQRSSNSAFKERLVGPVASTLMHLSTKNGYLKKQN